MFLNLQQAIGSNIMTDMQVVCMYVTIKPSLEQLDRRSFCL